MTVEQQVDTVVVGGGQAGLAVGYYLKSSNREFVILDASERVGDSWRKRWPSLRLYSPAKLDGLPGMPFPAPKHSFPSGAEMADYLETYAATFELPVESGARVESLERNGDGYVVHAGGRRLHARNVVVATGVFQHDGPVVPEFAADLDPSTTQLHSADYRGPEQLRPGPVLVVGAAHSGGDIAYEVARAGHPTILSGRDTGQLRVDIESRKARAGFVVLRFLWTRVLTVSTPIGRKVKTEVRTHGGPLLRVKRADLEAAGVERVLERTIAAEDGKPQLADGRTLDVANVVWCTGFRNDYSWIRFPLPLEEDGYPEQRHGAVSSLPGLYFVGLPFLHSFASMLVLGAGRDGKRVAKHIASRSSASRGSADRDEQTLVWNGTVADVRMRPEAGETVRATPEA
jgi:putative flavoprotein involved in K+ transport